MGLVDERLRFGVLSAHFYSPSHVKGEGKPGAQSPIRKRRCPAAPLEALGPGPPPPPGRRPDAPWCCHRRVPPPPVLHHGLRRIVPCRLRPCRSCFLRPGPTPDHEPNCVPQGPRSGPGSRDLGMGPSAETGLYRGDSARWGVWTGPDPVGPVTHRKRQRCRRTGRRPREGQPCAGRGAAART